MVSSLTSDSDISEPDREAFDRNRMVMDSVMTISNAPKAYRARRVPTQNPVSTLSLSQQDFVMEDAGFDDESDEAGNGEDAYEAIKAREDEDSRGGEQPEDSNDNKDDDGVATRKGSDCSLQ